MEGLYRPTVEKDEEERQGLLSRCYCFVKDYCGLVPVSGGILTAGLASSAAYAFGTVDNLIHQQLVLSFDPADIVYQIYSNLSTASRHGDEFAGNAAKTGFLVGQFLAYTAKAKFSGFAKSIFGKIRGDEHGR